MVVGGAESLTGGVEVWSRVIGQRCRGATSGAESPTSGTDWPVGGGEWLSGDAGATASGSGLITSVIAAAWERGHNNYLILGSVDDEAMNDRATQTDPK